VPRCIGRSAGKAPDTAWECRGVTSAIVWRNGTDRIRRQGGRLNGKTTTDCSSDLRLALAWLTAQPCGYA
jgi:hypothetical protein